MDYNNKYKFILSGLVTACGVMFLFDSSYIGLPILSTLLIIWNTKIPTCTTEQTESDSSSDSETDQQEQIETESETESQEQIETESETESQEQIETHIQPLIEIESFNFKNTQIKLIELMPNSLNKPCLRNYRYNSKNKDINNILSIAEYLNNRLAGTSYLKASQMLAEIDPLLMLVIINKEPVHKLESIKGPEQIELSVKVHDNAWIGYPTNNTLITAVLAKIDADIYF